MWPCPSFAWIWMMSLISNWGDHNLPLTLAFCPSVGNFHKLPPPKDWGYLVGYNTTQGTKFICSCRLRKASHCGQSSQTQSHRPSLVHCVAQRGTLSSHLLVPCQFTCDSPPSGQAAIGGEISLSHLKLYGPTQECDLSLNNLLKLLSNGTRWS